MTGIRINNEFGRILHFPIPVEMWMNEIKINWNGICETVAHSSYILEIEIFRVFQNCCTFILSHIVTEGKYFYVNFACTKEDLYKMQPR